MKWYETMTNHLRPGGSSLLQGALMLALSLVMSACLIIEVEITEEVDANGVVTLRIVVQEDEADANAWYGIQMVLVPSDWVFDSGTYDASDHMGAVGAGSMVADNPIGDGSTWADSAAVGVYPAPAGMKWVALYSDMAFAHDSNLVMETEVDFIAGATGGTFPVGVVVTKNAYAPSNGDWWGTNPELPIVGADSAMMNYVTVNATGPQRITLRELNTIPQAELDSLAGLGQDLTGSQNQTLILPEEYLNDTVAVTAVLVSDPFTSGRATWLDAENRPGRIHLWFVDTTASSLGREGMGMQVVDGDFPNTGSLDLQVGDVVDLVAVVSNFFQTIQLTPLSYQVLGTMEDFGLDPGIMDPIPVLTSEVNVAVGDGYQPNYAEISRFLNSYVLFENVTVVSRTIANTGRPDFAVSHDGGEMSLVDMSDSSLRYRNDQAVYANGGYNARESNNPFVPPPPGSVINLKGYIVAQGDDPNGLSVPSFSMLNIMPWEDSDLEVVESPPVPGTISRPEAIPGADPVPVTIDISVDPSRELASAVLKWAIGPDPEAAGMVDMVNTEGETYSAEVPALDDGSIVRYWVEATDNQGATSLSGVATYRVLVDGINSIADIQETFDAGSGPSPLNGFTTEMDITAVVQTRPEVSGILAVQDNADLEPWSGILVELDDNALALGLQPGDSVRITLGTVSEVRGDIRFDRQGETTGIAGATIERISTGKSAAEPLGYKEVTTDIVADLAVAEAHESMLLSFANVLITDNDNGFGEFRFQTVGGAADAVADDASQSLASGTDLFAGGEVLAFLRGYWDESFGTYRLLPEDDADIGEVTNVAVEPIGEGIPGHFALNQNYPNPFNPTTTITYEVGETGHVRIDVFDVTGRMVETLVDEQQSTGSYRVSFDAGNLTSGIYLYRMRAGDKVLTQRMLLVK